jgi:hypothetical protein
MKRIEFYNLAFFKGSISSITQNKSKIETKF